TVDFFAGLQWTAYEFREKDKVVFHIPGASEAAGPWSPQWGIFELGFKAKSGSKMPSAAFLTTVDGTTQTGSDKLEVAFHVTDSFTLDTPVIDLGEITNSTPTLEREIIVYSLTRESLSDLVVRPDGPDGPAGMGGFIRAGKPVPLSAADLEAFAAALEKKVGQAI